MATACRHRSASRYRDRRAAVRSDSRHNRLVPRLSPKVTSYEGWSPLVVLERAQHGAEVVNKSRRSALSWSRAFRPCRRRTTEDLQERPVGTAERDGQILGELRAVHEDSRPNAVEYL